MSNIENKELNRIQSYLKQTKEQELGIRRKNRWTYVHNHVFVKLLDFAGVFLSQITPQSNIDEISINMMSNSDSILSKWKEGREKKQERA